MQLLILANNLSRPTLRQLRIVRHRLGNAEASIVSHVVLQHINDKFFLYGLPHAIYMKGMELSVFVLSAKHLQGLGLRGGRKGKEGQVLMLAMGQHFPNDFIILIHFLLGLALQLRILTQSIFGIRQGRLQLQGCRASLGTMSFVNDDGKVPSCHLVHFLIDNRELLQGGNDNAGAVIDGVFKVLGSLVLVDGRKETFLMLESGDSFLQLLVKHSTVSDDNNAAEDMVILTVMQTCQTISCPGNRVGLAGTGTVLNQIIMAGAMFAYMADELPNHIQLMETREDKRLFLGNLDRLIVHNLFLVLDLQMDKPLENIHHAVLLEYLLPEIGGRIVILVRRIALAPVLACPVGALVEGQEIRILPRQFCSHPDFCMVYTEITKDSLVELEADFSWVTVIHPLTLGILHRLPRILVLQLPGKDWNTIHRQHHIH